MLAIQKFQHVDWLKTYQLVPTLQKVEIKLHVYLYERVIKCSESFELPDIFCENLTEKFNELLAFIFPALSRKTGTFKLQCLVFGRGTAKQMCSSGRPTYLYNMMCCDILSRPL